MDQGLLVVGEVLLAVVVRAAAAAVSVAVPDVVDDVRTEAFTLIMINPLDNFQYNFIILFIYHSFN